MLLSVQSHTTTLPKTRTARLWQAERRPRVRCWSSKHVWQYFLRCEPRSAWPDHPNNSRGLNAFDSFVEEAVLEAVDDAELHRRTQRFYEFAHQGDYKFLDYEKLKETHFRARPAADVARRLSRRAVNPSTAICRPWATIPNAPTPRSPSSGQLVIYRTSGTTSLATPSIFGAVLRHADLVEILPGGCVRIKNSGPGCPSELLSWSTRIHRMTSCRPSEGLLMMTPRPGGGCAGRGPRRLGRLAAHLQGD